MSRALNRTARALIKASGLTIAGYTRYHFMGGKNAIWGGDACGCSDDRCIGFHHLADEYCGCLPVLIAEAKRAELEALERAGQP